VSSIAVGLLRELGAEPALVLGVAGAALLGVALALYRVGGGAPASAARAPVRASLLHVPRALLVLGALTALAFVVENAWQSWAAVHLESGYDVSPGIAALGPAVFAAAAAAGRGAGHLLTRRLGDRALLALGASVGALGTLLGALAPVSVLALTGIAVAGLGTSICAPTLFSLAGRNAAPAERASAVSVVTTLAYLGFVFGPALVGLAAQATSLTAALAAVAALAALLALASRAVPVPSRVFAGPNAR
jgi:MFS family permease